MVNIDIIQLTVENLKELRQISIQTFDETFAAQNTKENMDLYFSENLSLERLEQELMDVNAHFFFAQYKNQIVAYLKLKTLKEKAALELERIYVLNDYQGMGIGQYLLDFAFQFGINHNLKHIFLGVWEHNKKAISFYEKNGFKYFDQHYFYLGKDQQIDFLMKRNLGF